MLTDANNAAHNLCDTIDYSIFNIMKFNKVSLIRVLKWRKQYIK